MIFLVSYYFNFGRMGSLDGKFLVNKDFWEKIQGAKWYGSDVLGKHSEIWGEIGEIGEYKIKELSDEQIKLLQEVLEFDNFDNYVTLAGFNPIEYLE